MEKFKGTKVPVPKMPKPKKIGKIVGSPIKNKSAEIPKMKKNAPAPMLGVGGKGNKYD